MKNILRIFCALLLCGCLGANATNVKPNVIPELKEWKGQDGFFVPGENMRIVYDAPALEKVATLFADDYKEMFGVRPEVVSGKPSEGDIFLTVKKDKKLGKEGYTVAVAKTVKVTAPEPVGAYWATRTLLQISEQSENRQLPKGTIRDYPDYGMRGFMIDCGRKFIPMPYLRDLAKILSYYKMNVLHVHLNDNGFK